ncbi:MAG: hypothetical protein H7256_14955 [Bdellovibrio sp.]|nr:hypothetical protein [Bdellovibrio sp.]
MKFILPLFLMSISYNAFAGLTEDFNNIKNSGRDFQSTGVICDGVVGELDIIFFNNESQNVDIWVTAKLINFV